MPRKKVTKMFVNQIKERLTVLRSNLIMEKAGDNHPLYIGDLTDSIVTAERELSFHQKNPDGVQMVNGN